MSQVNRGEQTQLPSENKIKWRALMLGPLAALLIYLSPSPSNLSTEAWATVAVVAWMVIWWLSEAVPIPATALLPIPLMPALGIQSLKATTASYAHPLIFLFLGGFLLAAALERSGLHKRIALSIIKIVGVSTDQIILGFMLATAFLSMWISNTATTIMMYAVALPIISAIDQQGSESTSERTFGIALMLAIAYSASIGGVGTLIGTPPNALLASTLESTYGIKIDFVNWMFFGIPIVAVMLPAAWILLTKFIFPTRSLNISAARERLQSEIAALGPASREETTVAIVCICAALGWVFGKAISHATGLPITDTGVAMSAALLLFAIPVSFETGRFALDWTVASKIPWGILLILGGGLAIAAAFSSSGLAKQVGTSIADFDTLGVWALVFLLIVAIILLTEITSNLATTATFLPLTGAIAVGLSYDPRLLTIPIAVGASMAFMMPVATPPNAIVFSYEHLRIGHMVRAGVWLNLIAIGVCFAAIYLLAGPVFGISPTDGP